MTIKQQGGIFGRNPTFNEVNTDGDVSVGGDLTVATDVTVSNGNLSITQSSPTIEFSDLQDTNDVAQIFSSAGSLDLKADINNDKGSSRIKFEVDGSEVGRWLAGGGLCFNGDTAEANALDDYEEGTWTPAFKLVSAPTYSEQTGHYTKIGRQVYFYAKITFSGLSNSDTSPMTFSLPFTPTQDGCSATLTGSSNDGLNIADTAAVYFKVDSGSNSLYFGGVNDANEYDYDVATTNTSGTIEVAGTFTA